MALSRNPSKLRLYNVGEVTRTPDLPLRRRLHYPLCYTNLFEKSACRQIVQLRNNRNVMLLIQRKSSITDAAQNVKQTLEESFANPYLLNSENADIPVTKARP